MTTTRKHETKSSIKTSHDLTDIRVGFLISEAPYSLQEGGVVFRGDTRDFKYIFENGFTARGANTDLLSHVIPPDGIYLKDSAYISTSTSRSDAARFPMEFNSGISKSYIYKINLTQSSIDVLERLEKFESKLSPIEMAIIKGEAEKAVPFKIPNTDVEGCWQVKEKKTFIIDPSLEHFRALDIHESFIPNPHYAGVTTPTATYAAERLLNAGRTFGHVLFGAGLVLDGASLYREISISKQTGDYSNTRQEGCRIASGWAGAYVVGAFGAEKGFVLCGPLSPPLGSVACALVGGFAGSAIGYYSGSSLVKSLYGAQPTINETPHELIQSESLICKVTNTSDGTRIARCSIKNVETLHQSRSSFFSGTSAAASSVDLSRLSASSRPSISYTDTLSRQTALANGPYMFSSFVEPPPPVTRFSQSFFSGNGGDGGRWVCDSSGKCYSVGGGGRDCRESSSSKCESSIKF